MTKSQETQLALHEQRISAIETYHVRIDSKLDALIEKLDNQFVLQKNYEQDLKRFLKTDIDIENRLATIEHQMVTQDDMKSYRASQFWQKLITGLGMAVLTAIITAFITFEVMMRK